MPPKFLNGSIFWHWNTCIISSSTRTLWWSDVICFDWSEKGHPFGGWLCLSPHTHHPSEKKLKCVKIGMSCFPQFFQLVRNRSEVLDGIQGPGTARNRSETGLNNDPQKKHFFQPSSPAFFPTEFPPQSLGWWPCIHGFWDGLWVCKEFAKTWMSTPPTKILLPRSFNIFTPEKWWERKIRLFLGFDTFPGENC